jgi:hypothetical protein
VTHITAGISTRMSLCSASRIFCSELINNDKAIAL